MNGTTSARPLDVYLYGMTVLSTIHKIAGAFPPLDAYGEIAESYLVPGGETMNAAIVLSQLGLVTAIGGPFFGSVSEPVLRRYAGRYGIDVTRVTTDPSWPGVRDLVLVDDRHRTVFGWFGSYFSDGQKRWDKPDAAACQAAGMVSIDPYFGEESELAARCCVEASKAYVTIDCPFDGFLHRHAAATVVSREFRKQHYPGVAEAQLLDRYREAGPGLVVFSAGSDELLFGRAGAPPQRLAPFQVPVKSTLGAGDVFRAGMVYGLHRGYGDRETVRFAAALAAVSCTRMPIADHPPTLPEIQTLLSRG
jgi:sugar/nucleoside kinase (ribokinase family)